MLQKTFQIKAGELENNWYVVDATDKVLGRLAARIATILQGKHKPTYTPHMDTGDYIVVVNASKIKLTGKKAEMKTYNHHTGYIGGLKEIPLARMMEKHPEQILTHAVKGMLPKTKLGAKMLKKLKVYMGADHEQVAQQPQVLEL